nr:hypothetical protein [Asanoa ishikariensis]
MPSIGADAVTSNQGPSASAAFNLRTISAYCTTGTCPTVYDSGRGTIVVQGYIVTGDHAGVTLPDGEQLVEIPVELLKNAARGLS